MKILVVGNIGSGKSTLCQEILQRNNKWKLVSIDEFRKQYGDNTGEGEILAKRQFLNEVIGKQKLQIIECTGLGELGLALWKQLKDHKNILVVVIKCDPDICLARIQNRDWSQIPYPQVKEKMSDTIYRVTRKMLIISNK